MSADSDRIAELEGMVKELTETVTALTTPPLLYGTIARIEGENVIALVGGAYNRLPLDAKLKKKKPVVGCSVLFSPVTKGIVDIEHRAWPGKTHPVKRIVSDEFVELEGDLGATSGRLIWYPQGMVINPGDMVLTDQSTSVVLQNVGRPPGPAIANVQSNITWDDVGSLEDVKQFFTTVLEAATQNAALFKYYNVPIPKGALLFGPPGCGKTLVAKAVAGNMARLHGKESAGFIYIKGPEVLSTFVGMAEERIRRLFKAAREWKQANGFPAIIFIDEAEAILSKRGSMRSSDVDKTIVPQFLSEMDGLDETAAFVLLATNKPDVLDSAVVREGRIDKKILIPRPSLDASKAILNIHFKNVRLARGMSASSLAEQTAMAVFSDSFRLATVHLSGGEAIHFHLRDIVSGAMLATITQSAGILAFQRDLAAKTKTGVTKEDTAQALHNILSSNCRLEHNDVLNDLVGDQRKSVVRIERYTYA